MTRMIPGYKQIALPYRDRLAKLGLLTSQQRQLRGDLTEVFNLRVDEVNFQNWFQSA